MFAEAYRDKVGRKRFSVSSFLTTGDAEKNDAQPQGYKGNRAGQRPPLERIRAAGNHKGRINE